MEYLKTDDSVCQSCKGLDSKCAPCWVKWFVNGFGRIFALNGFVDMRQYITSNGVYFVHDDRHLSYPRIGFITICNPYSRAKINVERYDRIRNDRQVNKENMFICLSMANFARNNYERGIQPSDDALTTIADAYTRAILTSGDESGIKIVEAITRRPDVFTLCSTDDAHTKLVPDDVRAAVAEALAGLAMIAVHRDSMHMAVGFAVAALFKHESALSLVNCARMTALINPKNLHTVLHLTRLVFMPYFKRIGDQQSYDWEVGVWGSEFKDLLDDVPIDLVQGCLLTGNAGRKAVVKGVFRNSQVVRKICAVCGKGTQEREKVKACAGCGMVYYCGKQCQAADWSEHKKGCKTATSP